MSSMICLHSGSRIESALARAFLARPHQYSAVCVIPTAYGPNRTCVGRVPDSSATNGVSTIPQPHCVVRSHTQSRTQPRSSSETSEYSGNAEALAAVSVMGLVPVADRGTWMVGAICPGAASDDAVAAIASRSGASVTRITAVLVVPAIFRPIPNVAMDVVKSPRICTETVHAHSLLPPLALGALSVRVVSIVIGLIGRDR